MKIMRTTIILLLGLNIFSCNQRQITNEKIVNHDTIAQKKVFQDSLPPTITELLNKALTSDSVEFDNAHDSQKSFLFFKSGCIISKAEKNAVVVVNPSDATYKVELYSIQNNKWIHIDSISCHDAYSTQFHLGFNDYNFDGQTDLYIQVACSNGYIHSVGLLLTIDPKTKKLELHKETIGFANMTPDIKTETIKSEWMYGYNTKGRPQLTVFTNKWIKGQLKTISKKDTLL